MIDIGIVGIRPKNGHPYSFSAIINGYNGQAVEEAGWGVIREYLDERDPSEIGFPDAQVTHVWTQDEEHTRWLQEAGRIPHSVSDVQDLIGAVDAVIIARDDYEQHAEMALPFLEADLPVFLDKPLAVDPDDLRELRPFLEKGQLMSCSGLRFARELDALRSQTKEYGTLKLVRGAVLNDWEKYGTHLLDALFHVLPSSPVTVTARPGKNDSFTVMMSDGTPLEIDAMGDVPVTFQVDIWGTEKRSTHKIRDNFSAFRRTLWRFLQMVETGEPQIPPTDTMQIMKVLIAGRRAEEKGRTVDIDEINI
jgi:predicted dehydrogenase